jgi:dephospho-CoA kinase
MSNLICIIGNIGTGKTTLANILKENDYEEITFAGPVKEIGLIFGFEKHELYGTQEDKLKQNEYWGVSGREFMQKFATDIMRNELPKHINMNMNNDTIWVRLCEKKIINLLKNNKKIIVSDGRFPDEINMIKKLGGKIIKIKRDNPYEITHESETYISKLNADIIIDNNGTIEELKKQIINLINNKSNK